MLNEEAQGYKDGGHKFLEDVSKKVEDLQEHLKKEKIKRDVIKNNPEETESDSQGDQLDANNILKPQLLSSRLSLGAVSY